MNNEKNQNPPEDEFTPLIPPVTLDESGKIHELYPKPARPRPARKKQDIRRTLSGFLTQIRKIFSAQSSPPVSVSKPEAPEEQKPETPEESPAPSPEPQPVSMEPPPVPAEEPAAKPKYSKRVFLVHGPDERMKNKVVPVLEKLGLKAVRFDEGTDENLTLYERAQQNPDVGFAVILLSIEDMAYPKNEKPAAAKPRVNQNVIFQLGFLSGKLGRQRVFVLYPRKDNFELPTRYFDAYYTPFDDEGRWKRYLVDRLKTCEYQLPEKVVL